MKYIIPSFSERFPMYESVDAAKNFLLKRYAVDNNIKTSEIDEETKKKILNDPRFLEVKDLTAKNTGYTPMFVKFRFDQGATMQGLTTILQKLEKYKQNLKNDLPMPVMDYEKVVPDEDDERPGYERLDDDLTSIEGKRKLKKLYNEFTPGVRRIFNKATPEQVEELTQASTNLERIEEKKPYFNPNTEKMETVSAWRAFCYGLKKYQDTSTYPEFKDPKVAINTMIEDIESHIKAWTKKADEDEDNKMLKQFKALGSQVGILYTKDGYLVVSSRTPEAQRAICKEIVHNRMCIQEEYTFWSYGEGKVQLNIINQNLPDPDKYHLIGTTVNPEEQITAIFDRHNQSFTLPNGSRPKTLKELLVGMSYPKDLVDSVLSKFKKETDIKLALERFIRNKDQLTTRKIMEGLLTLTKGFLGGVMTEEEWGQISGTVADIISQTEKKISKADFMEVFKDAGIFTEASLNVFDKMIGDAYTAKDINDIIGVTKSRLEDMEYILELYKENKIPRDARTEEAMKVALESADDVMAKLKDKIK